MKGPLQHLYAFIANLWSNISSPFQVTVEEYQSVVFIKDGKIVDIKGTPLDAETLEYIKRTFRSMDRAFDHMDDAFKEMDKTFQHMKNIRRKDK